MLFYVIDSGQLRRQPRRRRMSSDYAQQRKEVEAFFGFFATFQLSKSVTSLADLADGAVFFEILSIV